MTRKSVGRQAGCAVGHGVGVLDPVRVQGIACCSMPLGVLGAGGSTPLGQVHAFRNPAVSQRPGSAWSDLG